MIVKEEALGLGLAIYVNVEIVVLIRLSRRLNNIDTENNQMLQLYLSDHS